MVNLATDTQMDIFFYIICLHEIDHTYLYGEYNILCFNVLWKIFQDTQYYPRDRH
jgi:hypothetical protein